MPRDPLLSDVEVIRRLVPLPDWRREGPSIVRELQRPSFLEAVAFVQKVALMAEAADHHPDIDIRSQKVRLELTTHDSGGLTWRDLDLAENIERQLVNGP